MLLEDNYLTFDIRFLRIEEHSEIFDTLFQNFDVFHRVYGSKSKSSPKSPTLASDPVHRKYLELIIIENLFIIPTRF
jgi:hypothetical protein